jgi:hypothetical protein
MPKKLELANKRFGRLLVLEFFGVHKRKRYYTCLCDCGNIKNIVASSISNGYSKSCGCIQKESIFKSRFNDITGKVYGKIKVLSFLGVKNGKSYFSCLCECGVTKSILGNSLNSNRIVSCGCFGRSARLKASTTHGMSYRSEYNIWNKMVSRCYNINDQSYKYYGARKIKVSPVWRGSFTRFLSDMGTRPSKKHSIERINNNKGYSKNNCKWATKSEQAINTRKRSNTSSIYKGVCFNKTKNKWEANLSFNNINYYLGSFKSEEEAAIAYNNKLDLDKLNAPRNIIICS